jgi:hypothetical protein
VTWDSCTSPQVGTILAMADLELETADMTEGSDVDPALTDQSKEEER